MQAKVDSRFTGRKEEKTFEKGDTWTGSKERFEQINETLLKNHNIKNALTAVEEKEAKAKTTTKERKISTETK